MKRLSSVRSHSGALCNKIYAMGAEELSLQELERAINEAFLESMEEYSLPTERGLSARPGVVRVAHCKTTSKIKSV